MLLSGFPFTIQSEQFLRDGSPVFLNGISYQPLEPGQEVSGEIRQPRVLDDLRRWRAYSGAAEPLVIRTYAQPTAQYPVRMPQAFYAGVRELDFWIIRDIYFDSDYMAPDAVTQGKARIDAVISEVDAGGGMDRIFAWEIGNEFSANLEPEIAALENFLSEMRDYLKQRMAEEGREDFSDWVTWASWPPSDPLRTDGNPVRPGCFDFISYNAYPYEPDRIRDHQAGPGTGTPYAGYVAALKQCYPGLPLVISETGLPDSPTTVPGHDPFLPWAPSYRKGGMDGEQVAEGLADRYWDARLAGAAGFVMFEYCDEWHKAGDANSRNHPEEFFGTVWFEYNPSTASYEARHKVQYDTIRSLFTTRDAPSLLDGLQAGDSNLAPTETTTLTAVVSPHVTGPVQFRWEASRGYITGDANTVEFYAGGRALGPAEVTVVAIDANGNKDTASATITIQPEGQANIEILTLGSSMASGRIDNIDLTQWKLACWIEVEGDMRYVQPYGDMTSVWVRPDGYWWTPIYNGGNRRLWVYAVPLAYEPAGMRWDAEPSVYLAKAQKTGIDDTDNDLQLDQWETDNLGSLAYGRHDDPDGDLASNLEESLATTHPNVSDNDSDWDGLLDNWERRYFGRLAFDGNDDPDGDGLSNEFEQEHAIHPGRTAVDRDRDGLPDRWETRFFGSLVPQPDDPFSGGSLTVRDAYELGYEPVVLTVPGTAGTHERGTPHRVWWSGGDADTVVELWRYGPTGWVALAADRPSLEGKYEWDTIGVPRGWYCFLAVQENGDGWADSPTTSPGWVHVTETAAPAPASMGLATSAAEAAPVPLSNSFDWQSGDWGIKVTGAPSCPVTWPGGSKLGSELQVYYTVSPQDIPQFWVFQANGFWRQVSYANSFASSYRLFQYHSSGNQTRDTCQGAQFQVLPVTAGGNLPIALEYTNNAASGDRFDIDADVVLTPPSEFLTAMTASIDVGNVTGGDVVPAWDGHRALAEQWELFGFSSMYVADNLTGGLPAWYDDLDPTHAYVGNVDDDDYMNDGFSQNGRIYVPTHDVQRIVSEGLVVELDHSEAECPHVVVPGYTWHDQLVMLDQPSEVVRLEHLYRPGRDHQAELLAAGGLVSNRDSLKWAATYNRDDTNMVDGDNVQVKLGMDDVLNTWPTGGVQSLQLRLTTGRAAAQPYYRADGRDIVADTTAEKTAFRGVNLPGLEYGTLFHNVDPEYVGAEGTDYFAPRAEDLDAVAGMGLNLVRVPFEWARLVTGWQGPALPTTLNAGYLGLLDQTVQMASDRGLYVVLEMHDYLKYWSGQSTYVLVNDSPPHQQMLARTWKLLAEHYADDTTVLAYDLVNEPVREHIDPPNWHTIAQSLVNAIREVDTHHLVVVEGLNYSLASHWTLENGAAAFITDSVSPSRIVYSPHVYFDYDIDATRYDGPGEDTGPADGWQYYVRDRLLGVFDWAVANNVPIFIGETGVPNTEGWARLLDHVFRYYFEPLHVSVAAWQYIDRPEYYSDPLNLAADPDGPVVDVLEWYPGGAYAAAGTPYAVSQDSLLYDEGRVNPWQAGNGYWGNVQVDFAAPGQVHQGTQAVSVAYQDNYDGLKFEHHFGVDTQRYTHLEFWIIPTGRALPDFRIFTTAALPYWQTSPHPEYPAQFDDRPQLSDYASLTAGQWQRVRIPLADIVDPAQSIIDGLAFQNMGSAQDVFYLDEIQLVTLGVPVSLIGPSVPGEYEAGRTCGLLWSGGDSDSALEIWRFGSTGWTRLATNVRALAGYYDWDTTAAPSGWHTFAARVRNGQTWADELAYSPGWVHVTEIAAPASAVMSGHVASLSAAIELVTPTAGQEVRQGEPFEIRWQAGIPDGESMQVSLWVQDERSERSRINTAGIDASEGSFLWDTAAVRTGRYCLAADLGDDEGVWAGTSSPDWLEVV